MIGHKRFRIAMFLLAVWAAVALLAACGDAKKKSTSPAPLDSGQTGTVVGISTCATCHTVVGTEWLASSHANLGPGGALDSPGSPTLAQISGCAVNCHDPNADSGRITAAGYLGSVARPVVGCEACHGGGSLHAEAGGTGPIGFASNPAGMVGPTQVSAQFNTCTSCHGLLNSSGTGTAVTTHDPANSVLPTGTQYVITDTHFAVAPVAYSSASYPIAGYAMDFSSETVCSDCHNPHKNADINKEWAKSMHADKAGNRAWGRNWSTSPTCQRCHTTTGFAAYADALKSGDTTLANSILYGTLSTSPVASSASWKPEMLECKGCHTNNKGALRNPGAYMADYSYSFYTFTPLNNSTASYSYPDLAGSNVCMPCHTGRQNGDSIKNLNQAGMTAVDFSNRTLIDGHHYQAGAVMFTAAGYNFTGRDYTNHSDYMHDKIGSAGTTSTGTNGPCVGCHMSRLDKSGNHLFTPISSSTGTVISGLTVTTITGIASDACSKCHGPNGSAFLNLVNAEKSNFGDAQNALRYQLEQAGFYNRSTGFYPARDLSVITAGRPLAVNGSAVITGINTNWLHTGLEAGDMLRIDNDGAWYPIASVDSDTQITLSQPYSGAADSTSYTIKKVETVSVVTGTTTVTGSRTNWKSVTGLVASGDKFRIDSDGVWYTINSVDIDSQLTLSTPYAGASTSTSAFTLRKTTTASVANNSKNVTIGGANLVTLDVAPPTINSAGTSTTYDYFRIDSDGTWYSINSRTANTLTLVSNYKSSGNAVAAACTIIRGGSNRIWLTRGDTDLTGNTTGKNNIGVALTLSMFLNDPAAYVHNRYYAKRLIYDSIDWLDDGVMNYSTGATLNTICSAGSAPAWCPGAKNYILPNGVIGISAERP
jgi:hypothetical protein